MKISFLQYALNYYGELTKEIDMKRELTIQKKKKSLRPFSYAIIGLALCLIGLSKANGQSLEFGPFVGGAYYLGDLNPKKHFNESTLALGGILKYNLNNRWTIGLSAMQSKLSSDAADYNVNFPSSTPKPNLSSQLIDLALFGEINFFPYALGTEKSFWTPYIFGGGSVFLSDNTKGTEVAIPFGVGLKISPVRQIGLTFYWGARKTFTDDIDGVNSINYIGYNKDWYVFYGLNLTFAILLKKDSNCRDLISAKYY